MHDGDCRLLVHDEASAITAKIKNGQNSFDVIVLVIKLQSSTPEINGEIIFIARSRQIVLNINRFKFVTRV